MRDNLQKNIENIFKIAHGIQNLKTVIVDILKDYQKKEEKELFHKSIKERGKINE